MRFDSMLLILAIPAGYGVVLIGLAIVVHPLRRSMMIIAENMLADQPISDHTRARVNQLLDTCMSFRVGLILPLAVIGVVIDDLLHRMTPPSTENDARYHALVKRYFVSILAANPIAALISIPLMLFSFLVHVLRGDESIREAVEEPVVRASSAILPAFF